MPESWIDPESLEGDALTQWYLRSPVDVERERQEAAARRYEDFFYRRLGATDGQPAAPSSLGSALSGGPPQIGQSDFIGRYSDPGAANPSESGNPPRTVPASWLAQAESVRKWLGCPPPSADHER